MSSREDPAAAPRELAGRDALAGEPELAGVGVEAAQEEPRERPRQQTPRAAREPG